MVRFVSRLLPGLCLTVVFVTAAGCGGESVKIVPAEGVLKIGGRPAANVLVQFMPDVRANGRGPTSTATTDEQGVFRLTTQDGKDGAVVGTHMVVLVDLDEERVAQGQVAKKGRLDGKYAAPTASNLTATVSEGGGAITIDVPALK